MCTASAIYGEDFKSQFKDPEDGAFDISLWMSNAYGFIPILSLITEPALGYGLFGGVLFVHMDKEAMLRSEEKPQSIPAPILWSTSRVSPTSVGARWSGTEPNTYAPIGIMTSGADGGWSLSDCSPLHPQ
jgi:hypothetical protein